MLEVWKTADQIEVFESAWNFDHFYPIHGDPNGPCLEAWVTLTALATHTNRLRIGCMVHGMHFRHPAVTAAMAASLDIVSGGRLYLGLGAGWYQLEADAYGMELGTVRERMDRFEEGVEVVVRLLSQETTDFQGTYYRLTNARCEPKGPQRPHPPIAIGGGGERRTLRVVARWAQWWDALRTDPETWRHKREVLEGHCAEVGRDPAEITCSAHVPVGPDDDPGMVMDQAGALFDAGVDVAILTLRPPFGAETVEKLAAAIERSF
jgi:F420-dependent oxidoreductase-like protein